MAPGVAYTWRLTCDSRRACMTFYLPLSPSDWPSPGASRMHRRRRKDWMIMADLKSGIKNCPCQITSFNQDGSELELFSWSNKTLNRPLVDKICGVIYHQSVRHCQAKRRRIRLLILLFKPIPPFWNCMPTDSPKMPNGKLCDRRNKRRQPDHVSQSMEYGHCILFFKCSIEKLREFRALPRLVEPTVYNLHPYWMADWPEVLALKHERKIFRQSSSPVCGSWKSQASSPWA